MRAKGNIEEVRKLAEEVKAELVLTVDGLRPAPEKRERRAEPKSEPTPVAPQGGWD